MQIVDFKHHLKSNYANVDCGEYTAKVLYGGLEFDFEFDEDLNENIQNITINCRIGDCQSFNGNTTRLLIETQKYILTYFTSSMFKIEMDEDTNLVNITWKTKPVVQCLVRRIFERIIQIHNKFELLKRDLSTK